MEKIDAKIGFNHMSYLELDFIFDDNEFYTKTHILRIIQEKEFEPFKQNWSSELNNVTRVKLVK